MVTKEDLDEIRRDLQYLKDRLAIVDCIAKQSRGNDRHDEGLVAECFHAEGLDEHGTTVTPGPLYGGQANTTHSAGSQVNMHHLTTHVCEIDGDTAHADSYVMGAMLNHDGVTARILCGRYIDRLERRDGEWKILIRRSTVEVAYTADASILESDIFRSFHFAKGSRDKQDLSYVRPLQIDSPAPSVW